MNYTDTLSFHSVLSLGHLHERLFRLSSYYLHGVFGSDGVR